MRLLAVALLVGCTPAAAHRPSDPSSFHGVTIGIPAPTDARSTPGIGCGQIVPDLSLRAHKSLVSAFTEAGANVTNANTGHLVLSVALREAAMGPENEQPRRTDRPVQQGGPDAPPIDKPQQSWFNSGQGNVQVVLEATLTRDGTVEWRDFVSGHAQSAPCVQAIDKVREALTDAIETLRERVTPLVRAP
jgi:hypothetical protein